MAIIRLQTLTPQMRMVLMTALRRGGEATFNTVDVSERTVVQLSLRGWITTRAVQERSWREANGTTAPMITVGYQVALTPEGKARAERVNRA